MTIDYTAPSVDECVEQAIYEFPGQFANRTQVLHAMFIVVGSGYAWDQGVLKNVYATKPRTDAQLTPHFPKTKWVNETWVHASLKNAEAKQSEAWARRNCEILAIRQSAAAIARTPGPLKNNVHAKCQAHAPYFTMPAEVREDWAEARKEIGAVVEPLWAAGKPLFQEPRGLLSASEKTSADARALWLNNQ